MYLIIKFFFKILDFKRKIEEMKKNEYERLDRQYILKLQREKDSLAEQIIDLKKEIEFLNCLLRVNDLQFVLRVPIINNYYLVF